jgi:hypothetical protein
MNTDKSDNIDDVKDDKGTAADANVPKDQDVTDPKAELAKVQAELEKNKELLAKVRKFEKENKEAAEKALKDNEKWKELYEAETTKRTSLEQRLRDKAIKDVIADTLKEVGAKSISTVTKLLDLSKVEVDDDLNVDASSVKALVEELKKTDPILFGEPESKGDDKSADPKKENVDVKRAADAATVTSYEKEMKAAKSAKEIEEVLRKYGKIK